MEHSFYDKRNYPIVSVQEGYGEWSQTYEEVVQDEMDLRLLNKLESVNWKAQKMVLDLACGTGRIGVWLREQTAATIDGIDITPEMLIKARDKAVYRNLQQSSITQTGLSDATYDLCTQSLADEHLPNLHPLYEEVARVTKPGGYFVIVGYHPYFLMTGMPTHYDNPSGEPITIRTYVHLLSDHIRAAYASNWSLLEMGEGLIDEDWLRKKPKWHARLGIPISFVMVWQRKIKTG